MSHHENSGSRVKPVNSLFTSETKGPTWNRHSPHVVITPINRLCGVIGSW